MKRLALLSGVALAASLMGSLAGAEDLGARGKVYSIGEDARETIKNTVRQKYRSGEVDRYWQDYRKKAVEQIIHPAPLGIPTAYANQAFDVALRYVMPADFKDPKGKVIVRRGTVIEPLKLSRLATDLLFIDGRDERQVRYAIEHGQKVPTKIVLTAGSAYDLRVKYANTPWLSGKGIPFYFDQRKMIISSFKRYYGLDLRSVPVLLSQNGSMLHVVYGVGG